jgi:calcineurin-like phosphoesterase
MPARFEAATGDVRLCAVLVECNDQTGRAVSVRRIVRNLTGDPEVSWQGGDGN